MIIRANIKEAFKSLLSAKQRTFLALLGIVIGIASVIAMVSVGTIVKSEAMKQFKDLGIDIITIRKAAIEEGIEFRLQDVLELPSHMKYVSSVAPYSETGTEFSFSGEKFYMNLMGVSESFSDLNKLRLKDGRFISDLDENMFFCVLGEETARNLKRLGFSKLIGEKFKFGEHIYTVVGVLKGVPSGSGLRPYGINEAVITHITTGLRAFANKRVGTVMARIGDNPGKDKLKSELQNYFTAKVKGLNIEVLTAEEMIEQMEKQMRLFTLLLGAIGSIALIVGGVGVMNVMLVSVSERRKEIGLRRALGAHRGDIQGQFIIESIVLCLTGGIIGIALGVGVAYVISRFSGWEFLVSYPAVFLGVAVSTMVGIFFGFYPARQASKLDPIVALRT